MSGEGTDWAGSARGRPNRPASQRPRRVAEQLRHILSEILRKGEFRDPVLRDANITVTEVRVSPDLRRATAYVMPLAGAHAIDVVAALQRGSPYLRGRVARGLRLRRAPDLDFALDQGFDQADRISALLARPDVERDLRAGKDESSADAG